MKRKYQYGLAERAEQARSYIRKLRAIAAEMRGRGVEMSIFRDGHSMSVPASEAEIEIERREKL